MSKFDAALTVANAIEPLPASISADGAEIWDWAGRLSARVHLMDKINEVRRSLSAPKRCGACTKWMTRGCPREVHSNQTGRSTGPSMNAVACNGYAEEARETELRTQRRAELAMLETRLGGAS